MKADADGPAWPTRTIVEAFSFHTKDVENIRQCFVEQSFEQTSNGRLPPVRVLGGTSFYS